MNTTIPTKLLVLASGVALAVPLWAAGAVSTNSASAMRIERLERLEKLQKLDRVEKLQKLERLEKEGKLNPAQKAKLAATVAKIRAKSQESAKPDMIAEGARFDVFLKANPQIAVQLEKHPNLIDSAVFMAKYPALAAWLKDHPTTAEELRNNPKDFLKVAGDVHALVSESALKGMKTVTFGELIGFDAFVASHPAIGAELRSNPSLIHDAAFLKKNPELAAWLTAHPKVAKELNSNPQVFLKLSVNLYAQLSTMGLAPLL